MNEISPRAKVDKGYDLVNSKYSLSVSQTKIVLTVLSLIRPEDEKFKYYKIPIKEFDFLVENGNYARLKRDCRKLMSQVLEVPRENNGWLLTNWFADIEYKNGFVEVSFSDKLKPYLLQLKEYSSFYLIQAMKLSSEYAIRIYEMCNQYRKIGTRTIDLQELHELFQTPKSYQKLYSNFKRKVLEVAIKDINTKTDLNIEYEEVKPSRSVIAITFNISSSKKNALQMNDETPCMFDEEELEEKHLTFDDLILRHPVIEFEKKSYQIKKVSLNEKNKYEIITDREPIIFKHKNKEKVMQFIEKQRQVYLTKGL